MLLFLPVVRDAQLCLGFVRIDELCENVTSQVARVFLINDDTSYFRCAADFFDWRQIGMFEAVNNGQFFDKILVQLAVVNLKRVLVYFTIMNCRN